MANEDEKNDAVADAAADEEGSGKSKKKLLILIIAAVVVVGGASVGAFLMLSGGGEKEMSAKAPEEGEEAAPEEGAQPADGEAPAEETADAPAEGGEGAQPAEEGEAKTAKKDDDDDDEKAVIDFGCTETLKPFNLNLGNPLENRFIRMELAIEYTCGEEQKDELDRRLPQLRDAIINVTTRKTREFLLGPDGKAQLTREITNRINHYMTRKIDSVFITDILIE